MQKHITRIRELLWSRPRSASELVTTLEVSQPTVSRALQAMSAEVVRWGAARSTQYALRDARSGLPDIPVYQISPQACIRRLGVLVPVCAGGFVMQQEDGVTLHSDGLPWWLYDMRPQGYLGRAYALRHGVTLGLPQRMADWDDTHILRALLAHGSDAVGNLLLGDVARNQFMSMPEPVPVTRADYPRLAREAAQGEQAGSSAGGEQPKFTAYTHVHLIVKFSERSGDKVPERWRDLLLAEHIALSVLREHGVAASSTHIHDIGEQRFLEVERFDRVGALGRRALFSLAALDAEFVGAGGAAWPTVVQALAAANIIEADAIEDAALQWAFGVLIGNTDMHYGNLSFVSDTGRPYRLAPAYDMTPMAFAPGAGGGLPTSLNEATLSATIPAATWAHASHLAHAFVKQLSADQRLSPGFAPCIQALAGHLHKADAKIDRLG